MRKSISSEIKQYILENYNYDPIIGQITSKISGKIVKSQHPTGYVECNFYFSDKSRISLFGHYVAFLLMNEDMSALENGFIIHHKNGIRNDNRWENLEIISKSLNALYSKKRNNLSGYRGVFFDKKNNDWYAQLTINNIVYNLGSYSNKIEAAEMYDDFLIHKITNFDKNYLNFPDRSTQPIAEKYINYNGCSRIKRKKPDLLILENYLINNIKYDPITGNILNSNTNKIIGSLSTCGYIRVGIHFKPYHVEIKAHQLVWFLYYGKWPEKEKIIDHINRNRSDNRIENLRLVSHQENAANRKRNKKSNVGYIGVICNRKCIKPYISIIEISTVKIRLGMFDAPELAAQLYDDVKYHFFQDKAHLNFPERTPKPVSPEILAKIDARLNSKKIK